MLFILGLNKRLINEKNKLFMIVFTYFKTYKYWLVAVILLVLTVVFIRWNFYAEDGEYANQTTRLVVDKERPNKGIEVLQNKLQTHQLDSIAYYLAEARKTIRSKEETYEVNRLGMRAGYYYLKNYNLPESLQTFYDVIAWCKQSKDTLNLAHSYMGVAGVHFYLEEYKQAELYGQWAYELYKEIKEERGLGNYYSNMAGVFISQDKYKEAKQFLDLALPISLQVQDTLQLVNNLVALSTFELRNTNYTEARALLDQASHIAPQSNHLFNRNEILVNYAVLHDSLKEYQQAIYYYQGALNEQNNDTLTANVAIYKGLATIYEKEKQFEQANMYLKQYYNSKELLKGTKTIHQIETIKWQNIVNQQKLESKLSIDKHRLQNYFYAGVTFCVLLLLVLIYYSYHNARKSLQIAQLENQNLAESLKLQAQAEEMQILKHEAEVQVLHRELTALNIQVLTKNNFVNDVKGIVEDKKQTAEQILQQVRSILFSIHSADTHWEHFQEVFNKIHPSFFRFIQTEYPNITKTEMHICAYIKLNMANSDIALLLNVSHKSLITSRYRIRKKLALETTQDLDKIIQSW